MPDTFHKILRDKPFVALDNAIFRDRRISLKARGLLCTCMSLPQTWSFSIRGLAAICKESRTAIESALDELEANGYLRRSRTQEHNEDGTFGGTDYAFFEVPELDAPDPAPCAQNMHTVPCAQKPHADNPHAENVPQYKKEQEKKEQETPQAPHRGRRLKAVPEWEPEMFERFWQAFPPEGRKDRPMAVREWDRLKPDRALMHRMGRALDRQKASDRWMRGIGIPYAGRWLSHRRWEDTPDPDPVCPIPQTRGCVQSPEVEAW